jgi:hypothetical protein
MSHSCMRVQSSTYWSSDYLVMNVPQVRLPNSFDLREPAGRFCQLKFTDLGKGQ